MFEVFLQSGSGDGPARRNEASSRGVTRVPETHLRHKPWFELNFYSAVCFRSSRLVAVYSSNHRLGNPQPQQDDETSRKLVSVSNFRKRFEFNKRGEERKNNSFHQSINLSLPGSSAVITSIETL